jgi:hypothetical protein
VQPSAVFNPHHQVGVEMDQVASGSPRDFYFSLPINASRSAFWELWINTAAWASWDTPLQSASLKAPMAMGVQGQLITKAGQKSSFVISEFQPLEAYTMTTALPLGQLEVRRFFSERNGQLEFTHRVRFLGLSAGVFAALLGRGFMQELPAVMQNLKNLAETS